MAERRQRDEVDAAAGKSIDFTFRAPLRVRLTSSMLVPWGGYRRDNLAVIHEKPKIRSTVKRADRYRLPQGTIAALDLRPETP